MENFSTQIQDKRGIHYSFRDFVESGGDESNSPFLRPSSRKISSFLGLPLALFSAYLLLLSYFAQSHFSYEKSATVLLSLVYFISGTRALQRSVEDLLDLEINIDVLMTMAAYICLFMNSGFEGALLLVMFDISRNMEHAVNQKARKNLMSLRESAPEKASLVESMDSNEPAKLRHIQDIPVGSLIYVKAGEIVPLDGSLESQVAALSTAHLTGESLPLSLKQGESIASGSQILEKAIFIRVTKPASEATLSQIIRLISEAQESKPKLQRTFDNISDYYAKTIIILSSLFAFGLPYVMNIGFWGNEGSLYRALSFLIAASPCALILAIPIAYLSALSACAKKGIVLKGGSIFDRLASCKQIAFDKTGTLTEAKAQVVDSKQIGSLPSWFLPAVLSLEKQTEHPLAKTIIEYLSAQHTALKIDELEKTHVIPGKGIEAIVNQKPIKIGSVDYALCLENEKTKQETLLEIQKMKDKGFIVVVASTDTGVYLMALADQIREGIASAIQKLKNNLKLDVWMLTGDSEAQAKKIAAATFIDHWKAELKPQDKLQCIKDLTSIAPLIMVGDGVNDAPALAGASVGIAMAGIGSSAAAHAADVLLLDDDSSQIPWLLEKAQKTRRIIWQNLSLAGAAIILASSAALMGVIPLWLAVVAHEGGTILVGLNGLRLIQKKD